MLLAFPASAAKWDIVPMLSGDVTYTDNVSLAPDALKSSDWVTQIIPAISITGTGPGLSVRANYAPQITYYAQDVQNSNDIYQNGNASLSAELANKLLFIDTGASVGQYNVSLQGPLTGNNVNVTGNRSTVKTFYVSPYVRHDFDSEVQAQARFTYSATNSDNSQLQPQTIQTTNQDSEANAIELRLESGPAYKLLTWDLAYFREGIDYDSSLVPNVDSESILANARRLITSTVGLLAQGGYENYDYGIGGQSAEGSRWGVGFDWTPSPRTRLSALVGRRFFGDAYFFDLRHRARILSLSAGYTQDVTTTRSNFFAPATSGTAGYLNPLYCLPGSDPVTCQQASLAVVSQQGLPVNLGAPVNGFNTQPFLQKRGLASVAAQGVRNIIVANLFTESRTPLPGVVALNQATKQFGSSLAWNFRITARDTWNVYAQYTRNKFPNTGRQDDLTTLQMSIRRQFQPRLSGALSYRRVRNDSNAVGNDYTENAVIGTLQMSF